MDPVGVGASENLTSTPCFLPSFTKRRSISGLWSLRRSGCDSRSKKAPWRPRAKRRARVVFPHWRGPSRAVTGDRPTAVASRSAKAGRSITGASMP
jgi:hypothetical protein